MQAQQAEEAAASMEAQAASSKSRLRREQDARRLQSALLTADQVQLGLLDQTSEQSFQHGASCWLGRHL